MSDAMQPARQFSRYDPSSTFVSPVDARIKVIVLDEVLDALESLPADADPADELRRNRNKLVEATARPDPDEDFVTVQVAEQHRDALVQAPNHYGQRLDRSGNRAKKRRLNVLREQIRRGTRPIYQFGVEPDRMPLLIEALENDIENDVNPEAAADLIRSLEAHMKRRGTDGW